MAPLCSSGPLPASWVHPHIARARIGNFMMKKHHLLTQLLNGRAEASGMRLTVPEFRSLTELIKSAPGENATVTGVRLHFAAYKLDSAPANNALIPYGQEELLTFIFSPIIEVAGQRQDSGHFIVVDFAKDKAVTIDYTLAKKWVDNYRDTKMKLLQDAMRMTDPNFRETKSLVFDDINALDAWNAEIDCWEDRGTPIQGVYFSFAAFVDTDTPRFPLNQLSVIISLDRLLGLTLEPAAAQGGQEAFKSKKSLPKAALAESVFIHLDLAPEDAPDPDDPNYDTAHPCPPDANCAGTSLP